MLWMYNSSVNYELFLCGFTYRLKVDTSKVMFQGENATDYSNCKML